jgi:uncharacterized protein (DUF433 family)
MAHQCSIPGIETNPAVLGGKPVIAGTRIGVDLILEKIGDGESIDEILRDYPRLSREQVLTAIRYTIHLVRTTGHNILTGNCAPHRPTTT